MMKHLIQYVLKAKWLLGGEILILGLLTVLSVHRAAQHQAIFLSCDDLFQVGGG